MYSKEICLRKKRIMDYINKDPANKNLYRAYILLKILLENDAIGKLNLTDRLFVT
jgi:hypothetical protein